jgi:hypothetical protein
VNLHIAVKTGDTTTDVDIIEFEPVLAADTAAIIGAVLAEHRASGTGSTVTVDPDEDSDEKIIIRVDGKEVATFNHDELGWAGMNAVIGLAEAIADAVGATFEDNR